METTQRTSAPPDLFAGIEDDVELAPVGDDGATQAPPVLSRLSKRVPASGGRGGEEHVDTPPSVIERDGSVLHRASERDDIDGELDDGELDDGELDDGELDDGAEGGKGGPVNYRDEEDELDEYFAHRQSKKKQMYAGEDEEALSDGSSSDDDEDEELDAAALAGDGTMRGDMDAETQRLLREVAAKDRLGKGQKVQIKALSGIVDRLRAKKAAVVGRAAEMRAPEAPSFDDIIGIVMPAVQEENKEDRTVSFDNENADKSRDNPAEETEKTPVKDGASGLGIASFFRRAAAAEAAKVAAAAELADAQVALGEADDLDIVEDGDVAGLNRIVELPKMRTPTKPSPLAFNLEYNKSADMDDFEEKSLIDDGVGSDEESDSESDHSWAVHEKAGDDVGDHAGGFVRDDENGNDTDDADDAVSGGDRSADADDDADKSGPVTFVRMKDNMKNLTEAEHAAASDAKNATKNNGSKRPAANRFLDEEAELSDDEGMGIAVSDDEDDANAQDIDQNGELKDLIDASGKNLDKNNEAGEELHIKWARQQEAQQLKNILRGLENGFGRRGKGPLDDDDDGMNGRRRRARRDEDADGDLNLDTAWPSLFGLGGAFGGGSGNTKDEDGEECEDEAVLRKAAQRKLVESQSERLFGSDGSFSIPLDEDSQHVLGLFSGSQTAAGSEDGAGNTINAAHLGKRPSLKRLRSKDKTSSEPLSFIGRQSKIHRQTSKSNMGVSLNNKTYVFGRVNAAGSDSQMGADADETRPTQNTASQSICGAIDFSGLKNELHTQSSSQPGLLKALPRWKQACDLKKQGSGAVIDAVNSMMRRSKK